MILVVNAKTKDEVCAFACLSRITSLDVSPHGLDFAVGDGSGSFYLLSPVGFANASALKKENAEKEQQNNNINTRT